jgi:hypothetical protein
MSERKFRLSVPIDASQVEDTKPGERIKVVARDAKGKLHTAQAELDPKGQAVATFAFSEQPGALELALGPESMHADQIHGLRTITATIPARRWKEGNEIRVDPILITRFFWDWWRGLCRRFTITGRVLCADGSPAAGAQVCAYDIDFWWWWSSRQRVGCAMTDAHGAFSIEFTWCCGFLPIWWWERRRWELEPPLVDRIQRALSRDAKVRLPLPTPRPDLSFFTELAGTAAAPARSMTAGAEPARPAALTSRLSMAGLTDRVDPTLLSPLRERLATKLTSVSELEALRLWPWWPWEPWFDCSPDIIFRVTQGPLQSTVILNEGPWDVRPDIPRHLNVTLRANDQAICLQVPPHPPEGNCVILSNVCDVPVEQIAGNLGAPPSTPAQRGYVGPGVSDRPFGETVLISGMFGNLSGVDYYEFELAMDGGPMHDMPDGAIGGFSRRFFGPSLTDPTDTAPFHPVYFPVQPKNAPGGIRHVIESREHFEATHDPGNWGPGHMRLWATDNYFLFAPWYSQNAFADATYTLQLIGWDAAGPDGVTNRRVVLQCDPADASHPGTVPNQVVLRTDNRYVASGTSTTSSPTQICGVGTVHTCTQEPNTGFSAVTIVHLDGRPPTAVTACGNVPINDTDLLQIDFVAQDPDGHLGSFTLGATYDYNLVRYLIDPGLSGGDLLHTVPGATLTPAGAGLTIGPTQYSEALAQGVAASPLWHGGAFRLTINARQVFPETCCYQLELRAYKRTVVSCAGLHENLSEYNFMIVVS